MGPLIFPEQRYSCLRCGKSCGHWRIWVEPDRVEPLRRHPLALELEVRNQPYLRAEENGWYSLQHDDHGRCPFLRRDDLCGLHAESGWSAKPRACRQFPFFLVGTPDGVQVGLSFRCTALQENHGGDWEEHRADLEELIQTGDYPRVGHQPALLGPVRLEWCAYLDLERTWRQALAEGFSLGPLATEFLGKSLSLPWQTADWERWLGHWETRLDPLLGDSPSGPSAYVARYLSHVLERKWLWCGQSWLGRLLQLLLAERMLRKWSVEEVEGRWLAHRADLEGLETVLSDQLLQFVA